MTSRFLALAPSRGEMRALRQPVEVDAAEPGERLDWLSAGHGYRSPEQPRGGLGFLSRISILDRYLVAEMLGPFFIALAVITPLLLINQFFLAADYVINKGAPTLLVMRYLVLQLPALFYLAFPFATLCAVLLGFGRLAGDNEVTAMRTSGISVHRIALPCYVLGLVLSIASFGINESLAPYADRHAEDTFRQIMYHSTQPIIEPDQFIRTPDGQHMIYVGSIDSGTGVMHNVVIETIGTSPNPDSMQAETGKQVDGNIVLQDGIYTKYGADGFVASQSKFKTMQFPLGDPSVLYDGAFSPFAENSNQLRNEIKNLKASGEDTRNQEMILAQKYAMPIACLISILIALPLSTMFGRYGRGVGALIAVAAVILYYAAMAIGGALGKNGAVPVFVGSWLPNAIMAGVGVTLLFRDRR
ncbi:MAG TPA: LptF/LptG family permease [Candidatus Eremiobacteraceae bacterium]|nr:LptF/LptG family permease [Candidatus Eremiobacteraceae bacterium]